MQAFRLVQKDPLQNVGLLSIGHEMFPLRSSVKPVRVQELKNLCGNIDDSDASDMPEK